MRKTAARGAREERGGDAGPRDIARHGSHRLLSVHQHVPPERSTAAYGDRAAEARRTEYLSFAHIEKTLRQALEDNGFRPDAYDHYLPLFRQALHQREPLTIDALNRLGLGETVQRFLKKTPLGYLSIVYLYPDHRTVAAIPAPELQDFRKRHPEGVLTGVNLISQTLRTIMRKDAIRASSLGLALVFGLVWIGFRSFTRACFVFVPFVAGGTCMLRIHDGVRPRVQLHECLRRVDARRHGNRLRRVHVAAL